MLAKGLLWTTVTLALAGLPQGARAQGDQPTLLGNYVDWGAYSATPAGKKVCFALSKPKTSLTNPPGRKRDPAYLFVSTRPAENVRNEVSIVIGYPFKAGYEASVDIGSNKYAMYTQGDGAWVKNPAEEARMVDTMRRGADLVVIGESGKGTKSTDRYALKGLSQALDRVAAECK
jgi:invasion protein IalB